jgi:hypothetical protein
METVSFQETRRRCTVYTDFVVLFATLVFIERLLSGSTHNSMQLLPSKLSVKNCRKFSYEVRVMLREGECVRHGPTVLATYNFL